MVCELNQSAPKSHPRKFQNFEKVVPSEQVLSEEEFFLPRVPPQSSWILDKVFGLFQQHFSLHSSLIVRITRTSIDLELMFAINLVLTKLVCGLVE